MSVIRLHHVNVCSDDVAASARYYAELLDGGAIIFMQDLHGVTLEPYFPANSRAG